MAVGAFERDSFISWIIEDGGCELDKTTNTLSGSRRIDHIEHLPLGVRNLSHLTSLFFACPPPLAHCGAGGAKYGHRVTEYPLYRDHLTAKKRYRLFGKP